VNYDHDLKKLEIKNTAYSHSVIADLSALLSSYSRLIVVESD